MVFGIFLLSLALSSGEPLTAALESFERLSSYSVTLRAVSEKTEIIRYYYKKPGYIRMEFEEPHKGAVLIYDPVKREVLLRPFGFFKSFSMSLSPEDKLVRSSRGHTVDESDIGTLLRSAKELEENGGAEVTGAEDIGGRQAYVLKVSGSAGFSVDGVNRYVLWLDAGTFLPLKAESYDNEGKRIEEVLMDDLEIDPVFPEGFFSTD